MMHAKRTTLQHTEATDAAGARFVQDRLVVEEATGAVPLPTAPVDEEDAAGPDTVPPPALTAIAEETAPPTQAAEPSVGTGRRARGRGGRPASAAPPLAVGDVDEEALPGAAPPPPALDEEEEEPAMDTQAYATPADALAAAGGGSPLDALPHVAPASLPPPPESQGEAATPEPGGGGGGRRASRAAGAAAAAAAAASTRPAKKRASSAAPAPAKKIPFMAGAGPGGKQKKKRGGAPKTGPAVRDTADSFGRAIHGTLKGLAIGEGLSLSKGAVSVLNDMLLDVRGRVTAEAATLARVRKAATLTARDIQAAVRLVFPGDLSTHAVSEGSKAVQKALAK